MNLSSPIRIFSSLAPVILAGGGVHPAIAKAVNLLIFIGFLYYVLRKPIKEFFAKRFASVREMLERAAKEKDAATSKMAELDARISRLDAELAGIKKQSEEEAILERARVEAETKREIEKLRVSTQREIESAKQVALAELREFAATKSVDLAEQIIKQNIKPEDDAKLLQQMADEMGKVR